MWYRMDLHNHSCLSPCGGLEMSPSALVAQAKSCGIDILALTDHNSALNSQPFGFHCRRQGLLPIFGLELSTQEELHLLALFGTEAEALDLGDWLAPHYHSLPNDPEKWGDQVYVDEEDMILGEVELHLTMGSLDLGLSDLGGIIRKRGGLFIPAHIDRRGSSVKSQLGYLPPDDYSALEVLALPCTLDTGNHTLIRSSDAHYLGDVGRRTTLVDLEELSFSALKEALKAGRVKPEAERAL